MSKKSFKHLPLAILIVVIILLLLHIFDVGNLNIDNTTILLIIILLLVPFSGSLRKIKFGEFEAEIDAAEVKKIESEVKELPAEEVPAPYEINETIDSIFSVFDDDHVLALAKLRIELEKIVFKILLTSDEGEEKKVSLSTAIRFLVKKELVSQQIIAPLQDVIAICNRAIHGEEVKKETAESIINIGIDLLKKLHGSFYETISKPTKSEQLSPRERDDYTKATYHVTTVVPLKDEPYLNRYIFNQEQLDQFLDGYDEFAEFLVEIKKINNKVG